MENPAETREYVEVLILTVEGPLREAAERLTQAAQLPARSSQAPELADASLQSITLAERALSVHYPSGAEVLSEGVSKLIRRFRDLAQAMRDNLRTGDGRIIRSAESDVQRLEAHRETILARLRAKAGMTEGSEDS